MLIDLVTFDRVLTFHSFFPRQLGDFVSNRLDYSDLSNIWFSSCIDAAISAHTRL